MAAAVVIAGLSSSMKQCGGVIVVDVRVMVAVVMIVMAVVVEVGFIVAVVR